MIIKKYFIFNLTFLLFLFLIDILSQSTAKISSEIGQPIIKYYSTKEYNASSQNWCVVQDKRGFMYFGNTEGILEFDGNNWRLIKTPNNSIVRSLSVDDNGRIYVAASSDFGYLAPDSTGSLRFVSLLKFLDNKNREFGDVWDVVASSKGIYFKTRDKIFSWKENKIKVINSVNSFRLYKINDDVFARNQGVGLIKVSGDLLELIPDGESFSSIGVYDMLQIRDKILITTSTNGLFLYDGSKFSKFKTEIDTFLIKNRIYNACVLKDGNIAFATMRGGVAIINQEGKLSRIINNERGLYSNIIYDVLQDKEGGLWLAMQEGISRVEYVPAFSILTKKQTGNNIISSLYRFQNILFGANSYGLFYLDESTSSFKPIKNFPYGGMNFISIGKDLFATTNGSINKIDDNFVAEELINIEVPLITRSRIDTTILYVIYRIGLAIYKYNNRSLNLLNDISPVSEEMVKLVEDVDGSLWIKTYYEGIVHVKSGSDNLFSVNDNNKIVTTRYEKNKELPGNNYDIFYVDNKVLFATDEGVFRFDKKSNSFVPDSIFGVIFTDSTHYIENWEKDKDGNFWILATGKNGQELGKAVKQIDGKYLWKPDPIFRFIDLSNVVVLYSDYDPDFQKEFLWISNDEELIRYDPSTKINYNQKFSTYIRNVTVKTDSLIYNGSAINSSTKNVILPFDNNIQFKYSAASFIKPESNLYQFYLEGNDDDWSQWTKETTKEYTNLSSGDYKFHVRSKNVYGTLGSEDIFAFTVLSPWYLTWWAYFVYVLIFLGIIYQIRHFELKRLNKKHTLELELVEYGKLKELDQLKSQFFANISHEFRTPLTLILGQIDSVMSSNIETKIKGKLQVANRNARRLLSLINQLLDLSKLEAGSMELNAEQHNIVSFLKSLFFSFESLAESKKITLQFKTELENIPVIFDPDKMEKVFYNLISNAFKFTKENGEISINVKVLNESTVEIKIKDTGIGIPQDRLPKIFDRFFQIDQSGTREQEGTGIGLALTKELIELHKGIILVKSKPGEGSEFIINLPCGDLNAEKEKLVKIADEYQLSALDNIDIQNVDLNYQSSDILKDSSLIYDRNAKNQISEIILVVEDNLDVRSYICEQLTKDYKVIEAENGEIGIIKAQNIIPDLILTDVMMPKMDGYQFSKKIRNDEKTSHIPIIMLTAKAGLDDKIEGFETGVDAYLTKPFSAKELRVRVKSLIYQREQLRKRFGKSTVIKPSEVSTVSVDQEFLEKTINIIEKNFDDEKFGVEILAEKLNMSTSQLNRKLKALVDQPAGKLIRSLRLQRAADLLKHNSGSVAEICYQVGFNDQAYFSRAFKKQFGLSPSNYKK